MRLIMASKANTCIFPMQDILRLGDYSRMNFPSTVSLDNWSYRFLERDFSTESARWLKDLIKRYGR
jgi:4-alpha-glucanotransferase